MQRILSGIQPTGHLHLGNYLGALKNWVNLQKDYDAFYCIVDLHALTAHPNPAELREHTLTTAAIYIAAGIDPARSTIFHQSCVNAHAELMWILSCNTPLGWLNRMTQFKEKSGKHKDRSVLGLYSYPVLQAADILLYDANIVPVGADQKQHIEMTRDVAISMNSRYEQDIFVVPNPMIQGAAARVMSLRDGTKKMSKSEDADASRINMTDLPDVIQHKIKRAKTDAGTVPASPDEMAGRPEAENLLNILSATTDQPLESLFQTYGGGGFASLKTDLAEALITTLDPIRRRYEDLLKDKDHLMRILRQGQEKAANVADKTLKRAQDTVGLLSLES